MSNTSYSNFAMMRRFAPFMRPFAKQYAIAILLLVVTSLLSLVPPILLKVIIDNAIKAGDRHLLNQTVLFVVLIILVSGLARGLMEYLHEWVSARFIFDLRRHLFNHIQKQAMEFFSSVKIGEIMGRLRVDITAVYGVLVNTFLGALSEVLQIVGITAIIFYL